MSQAGTLRERGVQYSFIARAPVRRALSIPFPPWVDLNFSGAPQERNGVRRNNRRTEESSVRSRHFGAFHIQHTDQQTVVDESTGSPGVGDACDIEVHDVSGSLVHDPEVAAEGRA